MRGDTLTKKELVEIGGRPIIWHVMRIFSAFDFNRFVLTLGYEAEQLRRYFLEYESFTRDGTVRLGGRLNPGGRPAVSYHGRAAHPEWEITLADTGLHTEKGSRVARVARYLEGGRFFVTYGDGVGDVDLAALVRFHRQHGRLATITSVQARFQYGVLEADEGNRVVAYKQKPLLPHWINAGFMLFERPVLEMLGEGDDVHLEREILPCLVEQGELMLYRHSGFWRSMDTLKDSLVLEELWQESAPWKVW